MRERIDGRHEKDLGRAKRLGILLEREDDGVVLFDELRQIVPQLVVRMLDLDMAPPDPGAALAIVLDERQGLRIVDDDKVVIQLIPEGILVNDVFVDLGLQVREADRGPLQGVVHLLGDAEEVGRTVDSTPAGADSHAAHQQSQRGEQFGDAAAIEG